MDAGDAIEVLSRLRGTRVRFRIGSDGWVTGEDTYAAEIEGNLRFIKPSNNSTHGMYPTLQVNGVAYRAPGDPEGSFGERDSATQDFPCHPDNIEFVNAVGD